MRRVWLGLMALFLFSGIGGCDKNVPSGGLETEAGGQDHAPEPEPPPPEPEPSPPEPEFPFGFFLKAAPQETRVFYNGEELSSRGIGPAGEAGGAAYRRFILEEPGVLSFRADGCLSLSIKSHELPGLLEENGLLQIKLEIQGGPLALIREIPTGKQPKSAYFSSLGDRIFVPLLDDPGIDVFRLDRTASGILPRFERRLFVPGSRARGFVEAMIDGNRKELWVSNMEEKKLHIFDLETLEYKASVPSGGLMPKVIVQNPGGTLTAVSNWLSKNIAVIDTETRARIALIPVGGTPRGMAFSPDGNLLYTAIFDEPVIAVVDLRLGRVSARFRFHDGFGAARHVLYENDKLYVSDMARGTVNILDAPSGRVLRSVRVGPNINTIVLAPGGKELYAASRGTNNPLDYTKPGPDFGSVTRLSAEDLSVQARIWGRNQPTGLAVSPDGSLLVFTDFLDANMELYRIVNNIVNN